jgi:NAD(P)-dependent dehydrogenase (short-subunit alcohol dehydrogenase family)
MNKIALITGVSSGIGRATAELFYENGWESIGVSRRKIADSKYSTLHLQGDVSKPDEVERVFREVKSSYTQINTLVNNAAIQVCKPILETSIDEWDLVFNTNIRSAFLCSKYAYPLLSRSGGAIINVSSVHAIATSPNIAAYAASKGALLAFTRSLAIEFAKNNIRVNAVLPGAVDTPMLREGLNRGNLSEIPFPKQLDLLEKKHLFGKIGTPSEIAHLILFLSDNSKSSFITGQGIIVDGGVTAKLSSE